MTEAVQTEEINQEVEKQAELNQEAEKQAGINQEAEKQKEELDWTKDERYEKVWKKNPNNLFKSYLESQKQWHEFYTPLSKVLKERKIKNAEELRSFFKKVSDYDTLKEAYANFMTVWEHPTFGEKLRRAFAEIETEAQKINSDPVYQAEAKLQKLENKLLEYERELNLSKGEKELDKNLQAVNELAKKYGLKNFDEIKFIEELRDNEIPINQIKYFFIEKFLPEIVSAEKQKAEETIKKNIAQNKKASYGVGGDNRSKGDGLSFDEAIMKLFEKKQ